MATSSTTVWLHHQDATKVHREKVRWELQKNATCCFEHILEAPPTKTAYVQPLTSHLTNSLRRSRHSVYCWRRKHEHISEVSLWTPTHWRTSVGRSARTCTYTVRTMDAVSKTYLERFLTGERERGGELRAVCETWWCWILLSMLKCSDYCC